VKADPLVMESLTTSYNERLFGGGIRSYFHEMRYVWVAQRVKSLGLRTVSIVELGCYDGKTIEFVERFGVGVKRYLGLDANWEGGLDLGRAKWRHRSGVELRNCQSPGDIPEGSFDVAICLETLEHLPSGDVPAYIERLARASERLLVSVPVERGVVFVAKYLVKAALHSRGAIRYTMSDWINSALSRMDRVNRFDHRGFDERIVIEQIRQLFSRVDCAYLPGLVPSHANFSCVIESVGPKIRAS
jgi:Methyltransferase domain